MSIFVGKKGLRPQFVKVTPADLSGKVSAATAFCFLRVAQPTRIGLIANGTGASLMVCATHPEADRADPAFRLPLVEVPAFSQFNLDTSFGASLAVDAGTWLFMYVSEGTVGSSPEAARVFFWG